VAASFTDSLNALNLREVQSADLEADRETMEDIGDEPVELVDEEDIEISG